MNKFGSIKEIKLVLFDLEGVLLNKNEDHDLESLKNIAAALKSLCEQIKVFNARGGIVTASDDENLLKEFRAIPTCEILTSTIDKVSLVDKLKEKLGIEYKNIFYIGDDLLDIPLLMKVGFSAAPKGSRREVKRIVNHVCPAEGGIQLLEDIGKLFVQSYSE